MALSRSGFVDAIGAVLDSVGGKSKPSKKTETYTKTHPDTTKYVSLPSSAKDTAGKGSVVDVVAKKVKADTLAGTD